MFRKYVLAGVSAATLLLAGNAFAADVTLKLHQMLPPQATIPAKVLTPWAEQVDMVSGGRLVVEL